MGPRDLLCSYPGPGYQIQMKMKSPMTPSFEDLFSQLTFWGSHPPEAWSSWGLHFSC